MPVHRATVVLLAALFASSCAPVKPVKKGPPPPDPIVTTEQLAYEAERRINSAESDLAALRPDQAVEHLEAAQKALFNAKIDTYPDAELLRTRHKELVERVPSVREEVRKRELAAAVADARSKIDAASQALEQAIAQIRRKRPEEPDLKAAEDGVEALGAAIEAASQLESKDPGYSKYALDVRKTLSARRKLVSERQLQVAVEVSREQLGAARKRMAEALNRLRSKDVVDADFAEAEEAAKAMQTLLTEGGPLGAKDSRYARYAASMKGRLEDANRRIATRRLEVTIAKQKSEIETARIALAEALFRLKAELPAEGEFEEARNLLVAVEKTLDASEPLTPKDRAFSRYVLDQRKGLQEARARIERRKLEVEIAAQRAKVNEALAALKSATARLVDPAEFEQAETAIVELEKTIDAGESFGPKDRAYSKFALDARKSAAKARRNLKARAEQVAIDNQKAKVSEAIASMRAAIDPLDGFSPGVDQFNSAASAIEDVKKALDAGVDLEVKFGRYKGWAVEARQKVRAATDRVEMRRTEIAVRERKLLVENGLAALRSSLAAATGKDATAEAVKEAEAALAAVTDEVSKGTDLEVKDLEYRRFAGKTKKKLQAMAGALAEAKQTVTFRDGPIASITEGMALSKSTGGLEPEEARKAYATALEHFKSCQTNSAAILAEHPRLANDKFPVAGRATKAKDVMSRCGNLARSTEAKLKAVEATLAFYTGPAKSFETGKSALADAESSANGDAQKKAYGEAVKAFEKCIEQGKTLEYKEPQLKKKKFDLDGKRVTLGLVIAACQKGAKTARDASTKTGESS